MAGNKAENGEDGSLNMPLAMPPADAGWAEAFAEQAQHKPWLGAYGEMPPALEAMACGPLKVEGRLPDGLNGVLRRILAMRHEIAGLRYHHWWDGDGMLAEFRIEGGQVTQRARCIETTKLRVEREAGRAVLEQFGTRLPGLRRPLNLDDMNPANVNVLWHGGELLALSDYCSAWSIDPTTLQGLGPKTFSADTAGAPDKTKKAGHWLSTEIERTTDL